MFRSDNLYTEMNYVIENLSPHLLHQASMCVTATKEQSTDFGITQTCLSIINSVLHIIQSILSQEELPDFYEENLETLAGILTWVMEIDFNFGGRTPDELVKCRSKAISLVQLYQSKFLEHFSKYSHHFFGKIWQMVLNKWVTANKQNEKLIQNVIKYLSEMSNYPDLTEFFKINMLNIFTLIIVPNISITEDDLEEYEFEPDTYVKNDLEESDAETRRR
jgi:Cse1